MEEQSCLAFLSMRRRRLFTSRVCRFINELHCAGPIGCRLKHLRATASTSRLPSACVGIGRAPFSKDSFLYAGFSAQKTGRPGSRSQPTAAIALRRAQFAQRDSGSTEPSGAWAYAVCSDQP